MAQSKAFCMTAAAATLAAMVGGSAIARSQDTGAPTRVRYAFQSVGLVHGQTIRVGVSSLRDSNPPEPDSNPPDPDTNPPDPDTNPPEPDRVRIVLLDAAGAVVADSGVHELPAGPTRTSDVPRARLSRFGEAGGRVQVRVVVIVTNPNGLPVDPCRPGVELVSTATGRTTLALFPPGPTRF